MKCFCCGNPTDTTVDFEDPETRQVYSEVPVCPTHEHLLLRAALEEGADVKHDGPSN